MFNVLNNINMSYLWDAEITQVLFLSTEEFGKATTRIEKDNEWHQELIVS